MSLVPSLIYDWSPWDRAPRSLFNQLIGSDLAELDLMQNQFPSLGQSNVQIDKSQFKVKLDCHHFKPEEMTVKVKDNKVTIHCKHEEKQDNHGFISREFTRSYLLPPGSDINQLKSNLDNNGLLTLSCPRHVTEEEKGYKTIPIERGNASKSIQH